MSYSDVDVSDRDWGLTILLAFFGGFIGLHRFYCEKNISGVIYILTCGFLGIGILVDLILILKQKFTDKDGAVILKNY